MSAPRPRPVTATVTRQELKVTYRASSVSAISSGSSTDSLVSDVKRCGSSPAESSNSISEKSASPQTTDRHDDWNRKKTEASSLSQSAPRPDSGASSRGSNLSAWESWLLEKAKKERKMQKLKTQEQEQALQANRESEKRKEEKLSKVEGVIAEWRAKKDTERRRQQALLKKKQVREEMTEQEKDKRIQEQAVEKFKNWLQQKQEEERKRKDAEKESRRLQALELEERRRLGDEAFQKWVDKVASRPHQLSQGKGCTNTAASGRYNNFDAYPKPAFCNPVAWQPVCVLPNEAGTQKKGVPRGASGKKKVKRNPWSVENV